MRKNFCILLFVLLLNSCNSTGIAELNNTNINIFISMKDYLIEYKDMIEWVARNSDMCYRIKYKHEEEAVERRNEYVDTFFSNINFIGAFYIEHYKLFYIKNLQKPKYVSEQLYKKDIARNKLLERLGTKEKALTLVFFQECEDSVLWGWRLKDCGFVYSPDINLSTLTDEELSILGLACARKTEFNNWFFYGFLGTLL